MKILLWHGYVLDGTGSNVYARARAREWSRTGHKVVVFSQEGSPERDRFVEANAAALREHLPADLVFPNHVLLGAPVGAASGARFAVKAHGSELEYSMRVSPDLQI